jgi:hypothetical protein
VRARPFTASISAPSCRHKRAAVLAPARLCPTPCAIDKIPSS